MKNKNSMSTIIIIILSIITIGLAGYIAYDKLLNNDNNQTNNNQNENKEEDKDDTIVQDENKGDNTSNVTTLSKESIKEIFKFTYDYLELPFVYCGNNFTYTNEVKNDEGYSDWNISAEFTTYEEMLNSLKKYMSTDVIASKFGWSATDEKNYIEKNGKLYCMESGKGNLYSRNIIDINITNSNENKITFIGTMELKAPDFYELETEYDKVIVTLEKNNDNWIVASYEKQA